MHWKPRRGETYYRFLSTGLASPAIWSDDLIDKERYASRNCFRSEALAELAGEKVRQCLTQFHEEYTK
jgi:hypothetical protein